MTKSYTKTHEWLETTDQQLYTIGITTHAREQLGDLVFLELPAVGEELTVNGKMAVIESVKAASDIYSPITGKVENVNSALLENLDSLQNQPESSGWLIKIKVSSQYTIPSSGENSLLTETEYTKFISGE